MILGMDEAGRGPAIGPIVFGLVGLTKEQETFLEEAGIDDSKKLTTKQRAEYVFIIKENSSFNATLVIPANEIDEKRGFMTLNQLEVEAFQSLLSPYASSATILQIDAADVDEERFGNHFRKMIVGEVISKHKADSLFISVGAASILAKHVRDQVIIDLQNKMDQFDSNLPSFGSGYPTDAKEFLRAYINKYHKLPSFCRKSWKTAKDVYEEFIESQNSLSDYF